jgi:hypothetical protein
MVGVCVGGCLKRGSNSIACSVLDVSLWRHREARAWQAVQCRVPRKHWSTDTMLHRVAKMHSASDGTVVVDYVCDNPAWWQKQAAIWQAMRTVRCDGITAQWTPGVSNTLLTESLVDTRRHCNLLRRLAIQCDRWRRRVHAATS